jgi:hypothetical protein
MKTYLLQKRLRDLISNKLIRRVEDKRTLRARLRLEWPNPGIVVLQRKIFGQRVQTLFPFLNQQTDLYLSNA